MRPPGSSLQKIGAPGDEEIGARVARRASVSRLIPPSTWIACSREASARSSAIRSERVGHERLARVAGVDRHAEHEVGAVGGGDRVLDRRLRVERDSDAETRASARARSPCAGSSQTSTWNVTLSPPAFAIASK